MDVVLYVTAEDDKHTAERLVEQMDTSTDGHIDVRVVDCRRPPDDVELPEADLLPAMEIDGVQVVVGRMPSDEEFDWLLDNATGAQALARGEAQDLADRFPTRARIHINLQVHNLAESLPFYEVLLGVKPTKQRRDYAKFELLDPPVNLALEEVGPDKEAKIDHLGLEVKSSDAVLAARARYLDAGFKLTEELNVECCYSVQSKVWAIDPNGVRWETVNVVGEATSDQACPDDCICWNDFTESDRSYITQPATLTTAPVDATAGHVQRVYENVAQCGDSGLCCDPIAIYSPEEIAALPDDVRALSSGCGNPVGLSQIQPGQTVVDIGSGAGTDCLLAGRAVGPEGGVIGVDPSPTMRERAARAAVDMGLEWVTFTEGSAEELPLDDASADVVISNCVLAMSTQPTAVWSEISRVLRPGGSFVISDTVGSVSADTPEARARCEVGLTWRQYLDQFHHSGLGCITVREAGTVQYRDGQRVQSATIFGRRRPSQPSIAVQLFSAGGDDLAAAVQHQLDWRGHVADLAHHEPAEPAGQQLLSVLLEHDVPKAESPVLAFVDGRHIGTWPSPAADTIEALANEIAERVVGAGTLTARPA